MKKLTKTLSLVLVVAMVLSLCVIGAAATFTDNSKVTTDYSEAVGIMTDLAVVKGYPDGSFKPAGTLTRAEACVLMANMTLGTASAAALAPTTVSFKDVPASFWGYKYVEYCYQCGYIAGTGNGNFTPGATLTGYQWALMLMRILGYDMTSLTTGNWQINTAKVYYAADTQFSKVAISGAAVTRETASQMAYDALFASTNKTTGYPVYLRTYNAAGSAYTDTLIKTYSSLTDAAAATTALNNGAGYTANATAGANVKYYYYGTETTSSGTGTLAYTVFGVTKNETAADAYGRPATAYTVAAYTAKKNATVAASYGWNALTASKTVAGAPVATYTTAVSASELYKTLGYAAIIDAAGSKVTTTAPTPGYLKADMTVDATNNITVSAKAVTLGGAGVVTEIYATSTANHYMVVQIRPTLAKVASVSNVAATATAGAYTKYSIAGMDCRVYSTVVDKTQDITNVTFSGTVAKGDFVMIYGNPTAGYTVNAVKTVSGAVTGYASATNSWTIGGTAYPKSTAAIFSSAANGTIAATATSATYALDTYGNVVGSIDLGVTNYVFVLAVDSASYLNTTTNKITTTAVATAIMTDGTLNTIKVYTGTTVNVGDIDTTTANNQTVGLYTYKINPTTGQYVLTYVSNQLKPTANTGKIVKGDPTLISNTLYANSETKYYVATFNSATTTYTGVTTFVGYANVTSMNVPTNAAAIDVNGDGIAEVVFLDTTAAVGATANYVYVTGSYSSDGVTNTYDVIVNGTSDKMALTNAGGTVLTPGLYTISAGVGTPVTVTADQAVVLATGAGVDGKYGATLKYFTYNNGLLSGCATVDGTYSVACGVAASTPVYTFANGACTTSTAEALSGTTGSVIVMAVNSTGTAVQAIYVVA